MRHAQCCNAGASVALTVMPGPFADAAAKYEGRIRPMVKALLGAYVGCGITDQESAVVDLLTDIGLYMRLDGFGGEFATGYKDDSLVRLMNRVLRAIRAEMAEMTGDDDA
jgi:hypothetical protein